MNDKSGHVHEQHCHRIQVVRLGFALTIFFVISLGLCLALAMFVQGYGLHQPWLQFFPGFEWTPTGIGIALIEALFYAWYVAIVFGTIYNLCHRSQRG